jgi:hypothetical protein
MLYTTSVMHNKPNLPEEVIPLSLKKYSLWTDMKVNGWLFVAILTACFSYSLLHGNVPRLFHLPENLQEKDWPLMYGLMQLHVEDWPVVIRVIIELLPLFLSLLWIRDVARWIRGMDELHRRIMLESCLFAAVGTLIFVTAWVRLDKTGILKTIFQPPPVALDHALWGGRWNYRNLAYLDFSYFPLIAALLVFFFCLGYFIFNRRYK